MEKEEIANEITGEFENILNGTNTKYLEPNERDVDMNLVYDYVLNQINKL